MKKVIYQCLGILFLVSMSVFQVQAQEKDSPLDELMKKSGIYEQINQIPAHIQAGMVQNQASGVDREKFEAISRVLAESF